MIRPLYDLLRWFTKKEDEPMDAAVQILDEYVAVYPNHQNAIDIIPGWNHAFPEELNLKAGATQLYNDGRITWALEQFGSIKDRTVLELGPLEGTHTSILHRQQPARIDAIEANKLAYLRCLIAKEVLQLDRAHFYLGNFIPWLKREEHRYDLIIASGVLYHMQDPPMLLDLISRRTDAFFLWTHYFDEEAMPPGDSRRLAFLETTKVTTCRGIELHLHDRKYHGAWRDKRFCGGLTDLHSWMEKPELLRLTEQLGFDDIRITHEQPDHPNGPAISLFARRTQPGH